MKNDHRRRPYAKVYPYTWMHGDQPTAGIVFRNGFRPFLHVTPEEARQLADKLHDMADTLDTEPAPSPAQHATAPTQDPQPCYTSYSSPLTAADGTPEPELPATPAE